MDYLDFDESGFWLEPDTILANIVTAMVNLMEMPVGVTLFVKGMVISGTLVSEHEYLNKLTEVFRSVARQSADPNDKEEQKMINEAFDFTGMAEGPPPPNFTEEDEADDESDEEADDETDDEDFPPFIRYLHLKDFSVLTPHPQMTFAGSNFPILRIRLTSVDGWMLGQATPMDFDDSYDNGNGSNGGEILH